MPFVSRDGIRIHYTLHGDSGPAIVLLQGLGLSSRFWFDVPASLSGDAARPRRVVVIDNRGTGRSGRAVPFGRPWTLAAMADDVAAVLDDAGIDKAIVVGISMGGMIAQHLAVRHPGRLRGLLLLATSPGLLGGVFPEARALYRLLTLPFGGRRASQNLVRLLLPQSKWDRAREIFRDWPNAMRDDPTDPATFAAHLFAASTNFIGPSLGRIDCPVLVVAGADDALIPKRNAEELVRRLRHAELEVLPDTGHALFAEDRDLVRRLVVRLEDRIERQRESPQTLPEVG
jgi:3-oxoadipate enol-lactonase